MNKDHLEAFVKIATGHHGDPYKITQIDELISYCWETPALYYRGSLIDQAAPVILQAIREYVKVSGWTMTSAEWTKQIAYSNQITRGFFTILYSKTKDSISIGKMYQGYGLNIKDRIYPIFRREPLLCFSKRVYCFYKAKNQGYKPRLYNGVYHTDEKAVYLKEYLKCRDEMLRLFVNYKWMKPLDYPRKAVMDTFKLPMWTLPMEGDTIGTSALDHLIRASGKDPMRILDMQKFGKEEDMSDLTVYRAGEILRGISYMGRVSEPSIFVTADGLPF